MPNEELHFENAPIVEALITVELQPLADDPMLAVQTAAQALNPDYPAPEPLNQFQVQVQFGVNLQAGAVPQQSSRHDPMFGFRIASADKRQLVVFRRNGFSFSRLPPYERWSSFRDEARRLWNLYRSAAGTVRITGFGLRYINRLFIPLQEPVERYLRVYPEIPSDPDGSSPTIYDMYMRVNRMLEEPAGHLIIQQAMLPMERPDFVTISLDFDLRFPTPAGCSDDYVWGTLESARNKKNQLFIDSMTPTFLETFR